MAVSQDRDKPRPGASDHYPAMHHGFRWPRAGTLQHRPGVLPALGGGRAMACQVILKE